EVPHDGGLALFLDLVEIRLGRSDGQLAAARFLVAAPADTGAGAVPFVFRLLILGLGVEGPQTAVAGETTVVVEDIVNVANVLADFDGTLDVSRGGQKHTHDQGQDGHDDQGND